MHDVTIIAQDKARSHIEQMPRNDFIPLAIKTYDCLHPPFDSFLFFMYMLVSLPSADLFDTFDVLYLITSNEC
jgi:hypothetical protein